ncbi:MAG: hypothetical protein R3D97_01740 [Paracoccaceae bacterium]
MIELTTQEKASRLQSVLRTAFVAFDNDTTSIFQGDNGLYDTLLIAEALAEEVVSEIGQMERNVAPKE